mgnify:CR=1 FL=1
MLASAGIGDLFQSSRLSMDRNVAYEKLAAFPQKGKQAWWRYCGWWRVSKKPTRILHERARATTTSVTPPPRPSGRARCLSAVGRCWQGLPWQAISRGYPSNYNEGQAWVQWWGVRWYWGMYCITASQSGYPAGLISLYWSVELFFNQLFLIRLWWHCNHCEHYPFEVLIMTSQAMHRSLSHLNAASVINIKAGGWHA